MNTYEMFPLVAKGKTQFVALLFSIVIAIVVLSLPLAFVMQSIYAYLAAGLFPGLVSSGFIAGKLTYGVSWILTYFYLFFTYQPNIKYLPED